MRLSCFKPCVFSVRGGYIYTIVLSAILAAPALTFGFFLDDYAHLLSVDGKNPVASPWNVYCFAPGDPAQVKPLVEKGPFPWFTSLDLRVRFCRPLSSATMMLDRYLFGDAAWGYHLHSILWYLAMLIILALMLRRTLPGPLGVLVLFLFAVDESHWLPVSWWAHRNSLVAVTLAFAGLLAYVKWREDAWRPGLPLSLALFILGLLGGEMAFSILGYFVAYEMLAAPRQPMRFMPRVPGQVPMIIGGLGIGAIYVFVYSALGYGVSGTGCYYNPIGETSLYLSHAPARFLALMGIQFFSIPGEIAAVLPATAIYFAAAGVASLLVVGCALKLVWPELTPREKNATLWLALGGLFAMPPFLAPFTSMRLLLVPSLGGAAVIGAILIGFWRKRGGLRSSVKAAVAIFAAIHLVFAPAIWVPVTFGFNFVNHRLDAMAESPDIDDSKIASQEVICITVPDPVCGYYANTMRGFKGLHKAAAWRTLTTPPLDYVFTRTAANRFELSVINGQLFNTLHEQVARNSLHVMPPGTVLDFDAFDVTILAAGDIGPTKISFELPANLGDPRYLWLYSQNRTLRKFEMPPIGESVPLPWKMAD